MPRGCYNENMKNKNEKQNTPNKSGKNAYRAFPMKKPLSITLLCAAALALSIAGIALSSYRLAKSGVHSMYEWLQYPFMIAVCVFAVTVVSAVLIKCEYRVSDTELITCHGFVKTRLPLSQITSAVSDTDNDKIYLGLADTDGKLVITTTHEKREALVRAMLDGNPSIDYGFTLREKNDEEK